MIAMSALVRPTEGLRPVRQLEQSLRLDHESVPVTAHRFLVRFPDGPVLVTDELASLRVDVVVSDERAARHFEESFRSEIAVRLDDAALEVSWSRSTTVPQPLR